MSLMGNAAVVGFCEELKKLIESGENSGLSPDQLLRIVKAKIESVHDQASKGWY